MFSPSIIDPNTPVRSFGRGQVLLRRGFKLEHIYYIKSGRVALGVMNADQMGHQIGVIEGPCWLDASSIVLGLPHLIDALADTPLRLYSVATLDFKQAITQIPAAAKAVLQDMALAHRKQTEFAMSRLAKDAEARCAEWLLRHARFGAQGNLAVELQQRKRSIAAQLGIAPETFSRILRALREKRLISGSGRVLNLPDPNALRCVAGV